jgi:hypothetical protein
LGSVYFSKTNLGIRDAAPAAGGDARKIEEQTNAAKQCMKNPRSSRTWEAAIA